MTDPISLLAHICGHAGAPRTAAGLLAMFLLGAGGSVTHCGAMCGPIVVGQVADRLASVPARQMCERDRLRAGMLLPYHAGRLTTYAMLGAVAGAAGLAVVEALAPLRGVLLLAAAAMLLAAALGRLPVARGWRIGWVRGINRQRAWGTYLFGLALGLMPCGLIYAALVAAAASASPGAGAAGMLAFGLGTVPLLAVIGVAGQWRRARGVLARAAPWVLGFDAALLAVVAVVG